MKKALFSFFLLFFAFPILVLAEQIDINSATLSQLDEIVHVGPTIAQRITDARPYSSVHDLSKVKGIGDGKYLQDIIDQGFACVDCTTKITQAQQTTQETANTNTTATEPMAATNEPTKEDSTETRTPLTYSTGVVLNEILPNPEGPDETNEWIVTTTTQIASIYS